MLLKKNGISSEQHEDPKRPGAIMDQTGRHVQVKSGESSGPHGHFSYTVACRSVLNGSSVSNLR